MEKCIFCDIVQKNSKTELALENDKLVVFKDINPKADYHFLIVPKKHIVSIASDGSEDVARDLILAAKEIAKKYQIVGYKLVFNVGREGGQLVDHLHLHFLAGK